MTVNMSEPILITIEQLNSFSLNIGIELPKTASQFLMCYNGARPDPNQFEVGSENASSVRKFLTIDEIIGVRKYLEPVPQHLFPIAEDACGNYVLLEFSESGKVFFWDHELHDPLTEIAPDILSFLANLVDSEPLTEAPAGVVVSSVEINPKFEHILEKYRKK